MTDWNAILYDPLYNSFGVPATIETGTVQAAVTVIDQTAGVEIETSPVGLPTIRPGALVRVSELAAAGIGEDSLLDAAITIGSTGWTVKNVAPRPGPDGKGTGELLLILINGEL